MIKSARGLKANVRNMTGGDDKMSKAYIRLYFMERFMERISVSAFRDSFILKGGMLISSLIGIHIRATMDIDTTVRALSLAADDIMSILSEICSIEMEDNVTFNVVRTETIMDDFDYPGIRVYLEGRLEMIRQPVKIDISTDDVITPSAIEYEYRLMFEDRSIRLNAYNTETLLAEKAQTVLDRGIANTRMRDFYDIYELADTVSFSWDTACMAFDETCRKRGTVFDADKTEDILSAVLRDETLKEQWKRFKDKNYYVGDIGYEMIADNVCSVIRRIVLK